jgi:hypothetical protein
VPSIPAATWAGEVGEVAEYLVGGLLPALDQALPVGGVDREHVRKSQSATL